MTEFLLRSITKGKFEEWHPESFSSLEAVCEQVEDFGSEQEMLHVMEIDFMYSYKTPIPVYAKDATLDVRDMLADREREREENNKERDADYMDNDQLRKYYTERL